MSRFPLAALLGLLCFACESTVESPPREEMTEFWSRIHYYSPSGEPVKVLFREYGTNGKTSRTYFRNLSSSALESESINSLDSLLYDAAGDLAALIHRNKDNLGQLHEVFKRRYHRTGGRIDSLSDSLFTLLPAPKLLYTARLLIRSSPDGTTDTTYARDASSSGKPERIQTVTARDSALRTKTEMEYAQVFYQDGRLAYVDSSLQVTRYLTSELKTSELEWSRNFRSGSVDSTVIRHKNGTYRDSAYIYRNGNLYALGKYDYRKVDIEAEVTKSFGYGQIP